MENFIYKSDGVKDLNRDFSHYNNNSHLGRMSLGNRYNQNKVRQNSLQHDNKPIKNKKEMNEARNGWKNSSIYEENNRNSWNGSNLLMESHEIEKQARVEDMKKKRQKKRKMLEKIKKLTLEEFESLEPEEKSIVIPNCDKKMIKGFYAETFTKKIIKHFERTILDDPNFLVENSLPFKVDSKNGTIELKKGQFKKLFENPNFIFTCKRRKISIIDGEKNIKVACSKKLALTFEKTREHFEENTERRETRAYQTVPSRRINYSDCYSYFNQDGGYW